MYKLLVISCVFLLGFYFISRSNDIESFSDAGNGTGASANMKIAENCPDVLIQKGSALFLYNSKRANVPGVNPIKFANLEEYIEFTEWQRSQGILCPILFLQHAYNAQGEPVYKARPSPTDLQGGLPDYYVGPDSLAQNSLPPTNMPANPNIMPPPACVPVQGFSPTAGVPTAGFSPTAGVPPNTYHAPQGFDGQNQDIGMDTPLDKMFNDRHNKVSPNPMDDNWGGVEYTENLVKSGYYKGSEVSKSTFT